MATEIEITSSLTSELNSLHCLNFAERPDIKRGSGLPTPELGGCKLVIVGGSHTAKISALSRHSGSMEYIPLPGQPLSADTVTNLEEKIGLYSLGDKDILYIDLFSNSIFMGSNDGMPVSAFKNSSGTYHMSGCLEVAPEAFLRKCFSLVRRVLEAAGSATIICALALPRYLKRPCCNDENHMVNWAKADFNNILRGGSKACSSVLKSEREKHGLTIATFNPLSCFGQAKDSSAGLPIWREDDPVHLTGVAYGDIAAIISNQAETTGRQPQSGLARK